MPGQAPQQRPALRVWVSSGIRVVLTIVLFAAAMCVVQRLTFVLRFQPFQRTAIWAPGAVLFTALLLAPPRRWWMYYVGLCLGAVGAYFDDSVIPLTTVLFGTQFLFPAMALGAWVIRRVRALARKREVDLQPLDLNDVISDTLWLLRGESNRRGVVIQTELAADLPVVCGDKVHLQQVLLNLLLNGMEAMAGSPDRRRLSVCTTVNRGGHVETAVSDTGPAFSRSTWAGCLIRFTRPRRKEWGSGYQSRVLWWKCMEGASGRKTTPMVEQPCGSLRQLESINGARTRATINLPVRNRSHDRAGPYRPRCR